MDLPCVYICEILDGFMFDLEYIICWTQCISHNKLSTKYHILLGKRKVSYNHIII